MKIKLFILIIISALCIISCVTDHPSPQVLKVSENTLRFSGNGGAWKLTINSNCDWKVSGGENWCKTDKIEGSKTDELLIQVDTNDTKAARSARFTLSCDRKQAEVTVHQDTSGNNYYYELPVIFHLFYANETDSLQNANSEFFDKMIDECNRLYNTGTNSVNMNLKLIAASKDPAGNTLPEPGIERILKSPAAVMSCEDFMSATNTSFNSYVWDLNKYINVFVYTFKETNTAGIAHLPYTPRENNLPGLEQNNYYFSHLPVYTHCISINNAYIAEEDVYVTLAHELGHYLGLYHVFSEKGCDETDYCEDTPNYDRSNYIEQLNTLTPPYNFLETVKRTSCEGDNFVSTNIMDYFYSYQNRFTLNQYTRVRHVLENSPLIPGPKNIITTKVAQDDVVPKVRAME